MRILFDIGNTNVKVYINGQISFCNNDSLTSSLPLSLPNTSELVEVFISSVNKSALEIVNEILKDKYGDSLILKKIGPINTQSIVFIEDSMKEELGSDIYFALNSSIEHSKTFLNIDFGTALTFNLVIDSKYVGCAIIPGVYTSYKALISKASLLKDVELVGDNVKPLGLNTKEAINSGIIQGYASLVDEHIRRIKEEYTLAI